MEMNSIYHIPVLCRESIENLVTDIDGIYVDATMGGGGHTRALLQALSSKATVFAFDRDADALAQAPKDPRLVLIPSNFRYMLNWFHFFGISSVNGILADLGVSSHHFDSGERGFSFRSGEAMPDMRMNNRGGITAQTLLCTETEEHLSDIFYFYGELKDARKIASLVVKNRNCGFHSIAQLIDILEPLLPKGDVLRKNKLSRIFQALRIEVNAELEALKSLLQNGCNLLASGGRMVVISYHSLEDRLVKDYFRMQRFDRSESSEEELDSRLLKVLTKKPLLPTEEEISQNPRARSAKLRVAERK